jgi:hypothetical protein
MNQSFVQGESFNDRAFWNEINPILAKGTREMLINSRTKESLVAAYDSMDDSLGEVMERLSPPHNIHQEVRDKLKDRVSLVGKIMKASGIDPAGYWETDTLKVAVMLLKALGAMETDIVHVGRVKQDVIEALSQGNFTQVGAEKFLLELATFEPKNLKDLLSNLDDRPNHIELMRFLQKNGTESAAKAASNALGMLVPESKPMKLAKIIQFPVIQRKAQHI